MPPIKFIPTYKNPCFVGDESSRLFNDKRLHCLPYFYIIGVRKCGTSDLFNRISEHPEFRNSGMKEAHWFQQARFGFVSPTLKKRHPIFTGKGADKESVMLASIVDSISDLETVMKVAMKFIEPCSLPLTKESFSENVKRAHLQTIILMTALELGPPNIDPKLFDWEKIKILQRGIDSRSLNFYISLFDKAADSIQNCSSSCITADATPENLHVHTGWEMIPGNKGLTEPRYTNFHCLKHITPEVKIIIIFRDPVSRLFSSFMHSARKKNLHPEIIQDMFQKQASVLTRTYKQCFTSFSMGRCIYNSTLWSNLNKEGVFLAYDFRAGFYAFYMRELISVFGRNQIFPILMPDYINKPEDTLANIFRFLNMSLLSPVQMTTIVNLTVLNKDKSGARMDEKTEKTLYNFYTPFNKEMAVLMKSREYLFPRS